MTDCSGSSTTDNGTFLTIPDGYHQFKGSITLSASMTGVVGSGSTIAYPYVTIEGTPLYFTPGDKMAQIAVGTPAINLLSLLGTSNSNSATIPIQFQTAAPGGGSTNLKLHFNGATGVSAIAVGTYS